MKKNPSAKSAMKKISKALKGEPAMVPTHDDPAAQLRLLVLQHKAVTKAKVAVNNMSIDRKVLSGPNKGEPIPCRLPADARAMLQLSIKGHPEAGIIGMDQTLARLKREMTKVLKSIPIYTLFLERIYGMGPVTSAYLCSEVNIRLADKPSRLIRYCGMAVMPYYKISSVDKSGKESVSYRPAYGEPGKDEPVVVNRPIVHRLETRASGRKNAFNSAMRTFIYLAMGSMWKNAAPTKNRGQNVSSKYLDVWVGKKHGVLHRAPDENGKAPTKGAAHSAGWHTAARVLLEDLYIVWRSLEGLPVWPSYYAGKLGYSHGGKICVNEPKLLTVDEALALVGDVGKKPSAVPLGELEMGDDTELDEELYDEEAEAAE